MTYVTPPRLPACDICGAPLPPGHRTTCNNKWCRTEHLRRYHITYYHAVGYVAQGTKRHGGPGERTEMLEYRYERK